MTQQMTTRPTLTFPAYRTWRGGLRVPLQQDEDGQGSVTLEVLPGPSVEEMREEMERVLRETYGRGCVVVVEVVE